MKSILYWMIKVVQIMKMKNLKRRKGLVVKWEHFR